MLVPLDYTVPVHLIIVTTLFIIMDVLVGIIKAVSKTGFRSIKMREGLFHKLGELMCVAFGIICEISFPLVGINIKIPIVSTICIYIVLMETGSIVENLIVISPNIKNLLGKVFDSYKESEE